MLEYTVGNFNNYALTYQNIDPGFRFTATGANILQMYGDKISAYKPISFTEVYSSITNQVPNTGTNMLYASTGGALRTRKLGSSSFIQEKILIASDSASNDFFGWSVSISSDGQYCIVGAYGKNTGVLTDNGSAYIFIRSGTTWLQQAILLASIRESDDYFGYSVSISADGQYCIVGAYGYNTLRGSAYIFIRSGTSWSQQAILTASDSAIADYFGYSVSISGDGQYCIVGAWRKSTGGLTNNGSTYIFIRSGTTWSQQAILTASDSASNDFFGYSVSISADGQYCIVGAYGKSTFTGSSYIFIRSGTTWLQQAILLASIRESSDRFGISVSISADGQYCIVGAFGKSTFTGSAYIFIRSGTSWSQQAILTASDSASNDYFGYSVSISADGQYCIVGAYRKDTGILADNGSAYIFIRSGTTWLQQSILLASIRESYDYFGYSVSISGDGKYCIVGAYQKSAGTITNYGSAYIFFTNNNYSLLSNRILLTNNLTFSNKSIAFCGTGGIISQDSNNLTWDDTNRQLQIGQYTQPYNYIWTLRYAANNTWNGICWSPKLLLFCAVGSSGAIITSSNGISWTGQTSSGNFINVCWSQELSLFCVAGPNVIARSSDGISWFTVATSTLQYGICWSSDLKIFCAVGLAGAIATSINGISWITKSIGSASLFNVCWSSELSLFCAVGINIIARSSDGTTWTSQTTTYNLRGICWSPELLLFCGTSVDSVTNLIIRSTDGVNWFTTTSPNNNSWKNVCWSSELRLFASVSFSATINSFMTSNDGINWVLRKSANNNNWEAICWSPELYMFVAVSSTGNLNRVMTSYGTNLLTPTWISRSAQNISWKSICWSEELYLFCVVSNDTTNNRIMTSNDGINWVIRVSAQDNSWNSVCWSPLTRLFCAVSSTGTNRVMTSSDGITWVTRNNLISNSWSSICWSQNLSLFCAVSTSGSNILIVSSDGITWTSKDSLNTNVWTSICWSPDLNLFCVVGTSGSGNRVMTSPDGTTWTLRTSAQNNTWQSVCWSTELALFCAVSSDGTNRVMTSSDGINWSTRLISLNTWSNVCWSNTGMLFCAVATDGAIATSPNGSDWTTQTTPVVNQLSSVCWAPKLSSFCVVSNVGTGNNNVFTSYINTILYNHTWVRRGAIPTTSQWQSVCWAPELSRFCAVASTGVGTLNRVATSNDGIIWTTRSNPIDNAWNAICWAPELTLFCAISSAGVTRRVMTSPDGITWTTQNSVQSATAVWTCITWVPELLLFVALSNNNFGSITSPDGVIWTTRSLPAGVWNSVCWSSELGILSGIGTNVAMTSLDAITWISRGPPPTNNWTSVCWSPQVSSFCAVTSTIATNSVMVSSNGRSWSTASSAANLSWTSVCWSYSLNIFIAVSETTGTSGGNIMTSSNGQTWTLRPSPSNTWRSICWAPELNTFCCVAQNIGEVMTSYGINIVDDTSVSSMEVNSFTKGFIPSRMSSTEKNLISSPVEGLVVYDYSSKSISYYNGTRWVNITAT